MNHPHGRLLLLLVAGLCLTAPAWLSAADGTRGAFTVVSAETRRGEAGWRLDAVLDIRLSEGAREALDNGVPLVLDLQVQTLEKQPWLWEAVVAEQKRSRQLQYHALSRTYLVKNLSTGFQRSFRYLEEALQDAGVLEDVAVLDFDSIRIAPPITDLANAMLQFSIIGGRPNPAEWPDYFDEHKLTDVLTGYREVIELDKNKLDSLLDLMIETMIAEAVLPIVATGFFGNLSGMDFLKMILRKAKWLEANEGKLAHAIISA